MIDLPEFLLARFAEDENTARFAPSTAEWAWRPETPGPLSPLALALPDPARIVADCEAKRRIVQACNYDGMTADHVLECLALPYSDHPDYRQEWKP